MENSFIGNVVAFLLAKPVNWVELSPTAKNRISAPKLHSVRVDWQTAFIWGEAELEAIQIATNAAAVINALKGICESPVWKNGVIDNLFLA